MPLYAFRSESLTLYGVGTAAEARSCLSQLNMPHEIYRLDKPTDGEVVLISHKAPPIKQYIARMRRP